MLSVASVKVIPQALDDLRQALTEALRERPLPAENTALGGMLSRRAASF
jgi:hypothetical protein